MNEIKNPKIKTTKKVQELKQEVYSLNFELITKKCEFEREINKMKKEIKDLKYYKGIFDERREQGL